MQREGQAPRPTKSEWDSAENLIDGADGEASPPVVARIFVGDGTSPLARDGHGCPKF